MAVKTILSSVFGCSPIENMKRHITKAHSCVLELPGLFESTFDCDWQKAKDIHKKIKSLEQDADELKKRIRLSLPRSLFLPISRADILKIIAVQDRIANCSKDIAGLVVGRHIFFPEEMREAFMDYLEYSVKSSDQTVAAIHEMDALIASGFSEPEAHLVEKMIHRLGDIESRNDRKQITVRNLLFNIEKDLPPVDVIFLYRVIDNVGDIADYAHKVGGHLELMLAT